MIQWIEQRRIKLLYKIGGAKEGTVTEEERAFTFTVKDLIDAGFPIDWEPRFESWMTRELPNSAFEIRYTYEPGEYPDGQVHILLITPCGERTESSVGS